MTERANRRTGASATDSQLVAAHLDGDRAALAAIYDRYADPLYDTAAAMLSDRHDAEDMVHDVFVIAARRLDQLRQPDRLRSWLFAILRNEVYRRSKKRRRQRPTDFSVGSVSDMAAPHDVAADGAAASAAEMGAFVRAAAAGLAERDQLLLELTVRQSLEGDDLADAVGVSKQQCHVLVHRMRERLQRSVGALTVARYARSDCDELRELLRGWDGTFDARARKRVAGHIDRCETCERSSMRLAVVPLLSAAPALAAPIGLRERVLASIAGDPIGSQPTEPYQFDASHGFPGRLRRPVPPLLVAAAALLLIVVGLGTAGLLAGREGGRLELSEIASIDQVAATTPSLTVDTTLADLIPTTPVAVATTPRASTPPTTAPPTTVAPTTSPVMVTAPPIVTEPPMATSPPTAPPISPGELVISTSSVDLGPTADRAAFQLLNAGDRALDWSIEGDGSPFEWSSRSGRLEPGDSDEVGVTIDRSSLAEGDVIRVLTVSSSALGSTGLTVSASVERNPTVSLQSAPTSMTCPAATGVVLVSVGDEHPIDRVILSWSGPGAPGSTAMTPVGGDWEAIMTPDDVAGTWAWTATATDARGNSASTSAPFVVVGC